MAGGLPKDDTPIPSVVPGGAPVPASNTVSLALGSAAGKGKTKAETQPLVIPEEVSWTPTVNPVDPAKPRDPTLPKSGGQRATVTFVQDGDTATLKPAKGDPLNCRIDMIDAPETAKKDKPGQSHGEQSAAHLRRLIDKKEVTVWVKNGTDLYGRSLCQIEVDVNGKGVDVSLDMLQNGAAWLYRQYGGSAAYKNAADNAQYKGKGLFADRDAIHPREFKRQ